MANINQISVKVKTGNKGVVSGTNGDVYIWILKAESLILSPG